MRTSWPQAAPSAGRSEARIIGHGEVADEEEIDHRHGEPFAQAAHDLTRHGAHQGGPGGAGMGDESSCSAGCQGDVGVDEEQVPAHRLGGEGGAGVVLPRPALGQGGNRDQPEPGIGLRQGADEARRAIGGMVVPTSTSTAIPVLARAARTVSTMVPSSSRAGIRIETSPSCAASGSGVRRAMRFAQARMAGRRAKARATSARTRVTGLCLPRGDGRGRSGDR